MEKKTYSSMLDIWEHVCSGTKVFKKYKSHSHERRFLQALHSTKTHEFLARTISSSTGRDVTIGSAWIDGNPRFNWMQGASRTTGEISDLLVLVDRTDQKDKVTQLACMVQTKVSDQCNLISPTTPSTVKQLALYEEWPAVSFDDAPDIKALPKNQINQFTLNPKKEKWPFRFLQIGLIASMLPGKTAAPKWVVKSRYNSPGADEPFAILGDLIQEPKTLIDWLTDEVPKPFPTALQALGLPDSALSKNAEFDKLVVALLRVLAVRQAAGKTSNSGGQLIRFGGINFRINKVVKFMRSSGAESPPVNDAEIADEEKMPFLVLHIQLGPEGIGAPTSPPPRVKPAYPGASLLS